jgi:teichuronic acid biosynthesis glycosyltransferase TuaG
MSNAAENPKISVIMPAYNAGRFIEAAIRSVMAQTVTDWELLVIDDGSKDDTCAIAQALAQTDDRIRFLRNEANMGVAKTRNRGFELCRGRFVALLDSDDVWHPEKLERQLRRMEETGAGLSYCSYAIVDASGEKAKPDYLVPERVDFPGLLRENVIGCSTVMMTAAGANASRFETTLHHEDYALWTKLLRDGCCAAGCTEVLVDWRWIENSRSYDKRKSAASRWKIFRDYLKLPLTTCVWAFAGYALAGVKKYFSPK